MEAVIKNPTYDAALYLFLRDIKEFDYVDAKCRAIARRVKRDIIARGYHPKK